MSKLAMTGMFFGLGSFWGYLPAVILLQFWCGVLSEIFGIIAIAIGAKVWSTEPGRAKAMIAFGVIGLLCSVLTMAWWYATFGKF
jgi:hypothetical protein